MKSSSWKWTAAALLAAILRASAAEAQESPIVPGRMGPNALPAVPVEDAALPGHAVAQLGGAVQLAGPGGGDRAFTPELQVVVPFLDAAALEIGGKPLEVWSVSPEARAHNHGERLSGVAKGDLLFGARFALLREAERAPALTLRLLTKSTTGKALADARFTNAPGYAIEALASKTVLTRPGTLRAVRVLAKLGFLAWSQDRPGLQDDALDYGAAVDTAFRGGTELRVELRGYQGYQSRDKPMLAAVRVLQPISARTSLLVGLQRGIRADAPDWELRAGFALALGSPFGRR